MTTVTPFFVLWQHIARSYGRIVSDAEDINHAIRLQESGQVQQAAALLRRILAKDGQNFDANFALGVLYDRAARSDLSIPLLRKAVQAQPDSFEAALALGIVERDQGMLAEALNHLRKAVSISPDNVKGHTALGALHINLDDVDKAVASFHRALAQEPDNAELNTRLAALYATRGDPDKATSYYRQAISKDPLYGDAHYGLALLRQTADINDDMERMLFAFESPDTSERDRILLGYALGTTLEAASQFEHAFRYFHDANQLQRQLITYSMSDQRAMFDRHKQAFDQTFIEHCRTCCISDETPILVLGMPRSGTSLVEQILASHAQVHGAGEVEYSRLLAEDVRKLTGKPFPEDIRHIAPQTLRDLALNYIDKLKSDTEPASRVIDKLPHNFLRIGLFAALMPNAKFVLCERDALDNCMSIYKHHFSADHGYACNLTELGEYYKLYRAMMAHWMQLFPDRIHRVSYEELVEKTEDRIRDLLDYCVLPYDPACLTFHKTVRTVNTPSALQVREPMHDKSIGSARHYEQHLQPLIDALW